MSDSRTPLFAISPRPLDTRRPRSDAPQRGSNIMNLDRLFGFSAELPAPAGRSQSIKIRTLYAMLLALLIPLRAFSQDQPSELLEAAKKGDLDAVKSILGK